MKAHVYSLEGDIVEEIELPFIFETEHRPDVIKRAVLSCISNRIQPKGTSPMAGKRHVAHYMGKNRGISRTPRLSTAGQRAAFVPQAVGGRRAHPPKPEKVQAEKINKKEKQLAVRSAIAMSADQDVVAARGHKIDEIKEVPVIVEDALQDIEYTQEMMEVFKNLGCLPDLKRAQKKKIRSGKGKMRGRKYKKKKGPLLVVTTTVRSARNLPGVDVVTVDNVGPEHLAPGTHPGRLVIWTKSAIEALEGI